MIKDADALSPVKDPVTLAEKICHVLENDERRRELSVTLQAAARDSFSLVRMVDQTEALYREIA